MLKDITPVLLTYNEAPNIARTLSRLTWAKDIVVVDSDSDDETLDILARFPEVRVFSRSFDTHGNQWRFAVQETGISTEWILRLDADYQVTESLVQELSRLDPDPLASAYRVAFDYAIFSWKLGASLYPPNTILLRRGRFSVTDSGHTETWTVDGPVQTLQARVVHDDRKSTERWLWAQCHYIPRDFAKILGRPAGVRDWLRIRPPLMPIAVLFYCLFVKRLIFNGRAGLYYTLQRLVAEIVLCLMILEERLRSTPPVEGDRGESGSA